MERADLARNVPRRTAERVAPSQDTRAQAEELAVLMEIAAWREREAQERDVPRGRVLKDEVLGDLATQAPTTPRTARQHAVASERL